MRDLALRRLTPSRLTGDVIIRKSSVSKQAWRGGGGGGRAGCLSCHLSSSLLLPPSRSGKSAELDTRAKKAALNLTHGIVARLEVMSSRLGRPEHGPIHATTGHPHHRESIHESISAPASRFFSHDHHHEIDRHDPSVDRHDRAPKPLVHRVGIRLPCLLYEVPPIPALSSRASRASCIRAVPAASRPNAPLTPSRSALCCRGRGCCGFCALCSRRCSTAAPARTLPTGP